MKCLAILFITAIAATTLVSSNVVLENQERQTSACNTTALTQNVQDFANCAVTFVQACSGQSDTCVCCRSILGGSNTANGYTCCVSFRNYVDIATACADQAGVQIPAVISNCNLSGGAATTAISYFTGLLLLVTAVAYQSLF